MSEELLTYIKGSVDRIEAKQDKYEERQRAVETWQADANGKISMVGLFGVTLGGAIMAAIGYFRGGNHP